MTTAHSVIFLVRCGLVLPFFTASALDNIFNFDGAMRRALEVFRSHLVAAALVVVGIVIEHLMPVDILSRFAAFILARYCVASVVLFKRVW